MKRSNLLSKKSKLKAKFRTWPQVVGRLAYDLKEARGSKGPEAFQQEHTKESLYDQAEHQGFSHARPKYEVDNEALMENQKQNIYKAGAIGRYQPLSFKPKLRGEYTEEASEALRQNVSRLMQTLSDIR